MCVCVRARAHARALMNKWMCVYVCTTKGYRISLFIHI